MVLGSFLCMKLYLAAPLFTSAERMFNVRLKTALQAYGYEIWLPQEQEPRDLTAQSIFQKDVEGIDWADTVVACMDGPDPDSGTAWECGYAYGKGKPVICYRTDFRNCRDADDSRYNLMLWASARETVVASTLTWSFERMVTEIVKRLEKLAATVGQAA